MRELETVAVSAATAAELRAPITGAGRLCKRFAEPSHGLRTAMVWDGYAAELTAYMRVMVTRIERVAAIARKRGTSHTAMCCGYNIVATPVGSHAMQVIVMWDADAAALNECHDEQNALIAAYPAARTVGRVANVVTMVL